MCGIAGIIDFSDKNNHSKHVHVMVDKLIHRGPNNNNVRQDGLIASLGHTRLSIIDLDESSNQPMISEDSRYILVYNGEIYNFKDIKKKLHPYQFKTNSDTEVVLAAYLKWGKDCVKEFNGMFAFAIWDKSKKELFCSRDRLGIKPFYYYYQGNTFIFSSEVRPLISCPLVKTRLDKNRLHEYLTYQTVSSPNTILENIFCISPGYNLQVSEKNFQLEEYWSIGNSITTNEDTYHQATKKIKNLFMESVEMQMISDVKLGAFLSGGIDSSAIVAAMSEISPDKVSTVSVNFDEIDYSEEKFSDLVAKKYNTDHHRIQLKAKDLLDFLPEALSAIDHPSGDGINTFIVSKVTKSRGINVALSGLGGDELFAGYNTFRRLQLISRNNWLKHIPSNINALLKYTLNQLL